MTHSESARRREGGGFDILPKLRQTTFKVVHTVWRISWPQTGATHYHAQLGLPDKGVQSKGWLSDM